MTFFGATVKLINVQQTLDVFLFNDFRSADFLFTFTIYHFTATKWRVSNLEIELQTDDTDNTNLPITALQSSISDLEDRMTTVELEQNEMHQTINDMNGLTSPSSKAFIHYNNSIWKNSFSILTCLLPAADEVWGKVIFSQTSVCPRGVSVQWDLCPREVCPWGGGLCPWGIFVTETPITVEEWVVCILLECILVYKNDHSYEK